MMPIAAAVMMVLSSFARIALSQDKQTGNREELALEKCEKSNMKNRTLR